MRLKEAQQNGFQSEFFYIDGYKEFDIPRILSLLKRRKRRVPWRGLRPASTLEWKGGRSI